jgi:hypothetical protein
VAVNYSITAINDRLAGVVTAIDGGGSNGKLLLQTTAGTTLSTIALQNPCGTVNGGVLTFTGPLVDGGAANTGLASRAIIQDSAGNTQISGLTVGIPLSGMDILLTNGFNSTLITAGQVISLLSAQITGS